MIKLLITRFGDPGPVGTAKHELYCIYQSTKDLETFLNAFLVLAKKAKIDDAQTLDMLYDKLNDEFKSFLVSKKKQPTLDGLIRKLRDIDSKTKIIKQRSNNRPSTTQSTQSRPVNRPYTSASAASAAPAGTATATPFTATGTHSGPMDLSFAGRRGPLTQDEKDRRNRLGVTDLHSHVLPVCIATSNAICTASAHCYNDVRIKRLVV